MIGNAIQTLAGTGSAGSSGLGGVATSAALNTPSGLAIGLDGLVWIADTGNHRLVRVTATGNLQLALDAAPNLTPPTLSSPKWLCATETHLYLADTGNKRILRVDSAGTVTLFAGIGTSTAPQDGGAAADDGRNRHRQWRRACTAARRLHRGARAVLRWNHAIDRRLWRQ